mgnify:CR=1 FL=1|jgi:FkbM family methyltransferase
MSKSPTDADPTQAILEEDWVNLKRCKHGLMLYNRNDYSVGRCMDLYGEWCEHEVELLIELLKSGDVVLDVGANIGTHTVPLARAVEGQGGIVYAFEPQHLTFQFLCANLALNRILNVLFRQQAVGEMMTDIKVPVHPPWETRNFAGLALDSNGAGETVAQITIDSLALERVDLLKVDVEGMESQVLKGASRTIGEHKPFIFVENNSDQGGRELLELLTSFGYTCMWHIESYFNPENFYENSINVFQKHRPEVNMLCFHPDRPIRSEVQGKLMPVQGLDEDYKQAIVRSGRFGFSAS